MCGWGREMVLQQEEVSALLTVPAPVFLLASAVFLLECLSQELWLAGSVAPSHCAITAPGCWGTC